MGRKRKNGTHSRGHEDMRKQARLTSFFLPSAGEVSTVSSEYPSPLSPPSSLSLLPNTSLVHLPEPSTPRQRAVVEVNESQYATFQFPKFTGFVHHILKGLITIALLNAEYMKRNVKHHLKDCDHWELLTLILSFIPHFVQSTLNTDTWSWTDLLSGPGNLSYLTGRKGVYFGVAQAEKRDVVGYVGTAIGSGGLIGRIKNHLSSTYRKRDLEGERPKLFYKYVEGMLDGQRTLVFTALAYFRFTPDTSREMRVVLSDIVEALMMILLGTLQTGDNWYETAAYAKLRPSQFKCTENIIPSNRMCPTQKFALTTKAMIHPELPTDNSYSSFDTKGIIHFTENPHRPGIMAYFNFSELLRLPLPIKVLQCLQVEEGDRISVRFDIWESGITHPHRWLQEDIPGEERYEATRLGIEIHGITSSGATFSFWLRRNTDGEDWSTERTTSNHVGTAIAMSIIEALSDTRILPVPQNRLRLFDTDVSLEPIGPIFDLMTTKEYTNRVTFEARDYTAVLLGNQMWMDSSFEDQYLSIVCQCSHKLYTCYMHRSGVERLEPCPWRYEERCWELFETSSYAHKHSRRFHPRRDGPKTIKCDFCTRAFARDHDLLRHTKEKHPEEVTGAGIAQIELTTVPKSVIKSVSDSAVFTDSAAMTGRWIDDGTIPPYTWKSIIGMILLDDLRSGNHAGLSVYEIHAKVPQMFRYYVLDEQVKKSGWPMTIIRCIRKATTLFIKRGKPEDDRSCEKKRGHDKWIIKPGQEDKFKHPRRNLTKRSAAGGMKDINLGDEEDGPDLDQLGEL